MELSTISPVETPPSAMKPPKQLYLELLRIVAIFGVVFNHTGEYGWLYYTHSQGVLSIFFLLLSSLCKIAVPLFLMISGVVLLGKEESIKDLLQKRVMKMIITILFVSTLHYLYTCITNNYQMSIGHFLNTALTTYNLCSYYLWMYLALLMGLPLLRRAAEHITIKETCYLFSYYILFFCIFPLFGLGIDIIVSYLFFPVGIVVFPLLGYVIHCAPSTFYCKKGLLIGGGISFIAISIHVIAKYRFFIAQGADSTLYDAIPAILAIYIFYVTKYFCAKYEDLKFLKIAAPAIRIGGRLSFGIFIFSDIMLWHIVDFYHALSAVLPWNLAFFVWFAVTIIMCALLTQVIRMLCPPMKKILG